MAKIVGPSERPEALKRGVGVPVYVERSRTPSGQRALQAHSSPGNIVWLQPEAAVME
jgi:hypothetical protein